jgi:arylsulfatase A
LKGEGGHGGKPAPYVDRTTPLSLFNLETDIGEQHDVAAEHPEVVAQLEKLGEAAREDLGDSLTGRKGKNVRPAGRL